jgi:hypothetical protein
MSDAVVNVLMAARRVADLAGAEGVWQVRRRFIAQRRTTWAQSLQTSSCRCLMRPLKRGHMRHLGTISTVSSQIAPLCFVPSSLSSWSEDLSSSSLATPDLTRESSEGLT